MFLLFIACSTTPPPAPPPVPVPPTPLAANCEQAKNVCPDYAPYWGSTCPAGERCITFKNACDYHVALSYQIGCNGDGTKGAPQCDCTLGPLLPPAGTATWTVVDASYASCLPSWQPPCLTAGLAVMAGKVEVAEGAAPAGLCAGPVTRVEFTAGNEGDPYGRFDAYDVDVEKGYGVPVSFAPDLPCANDHANHDCREVVCDSATCPDAYLTPTSGGCADGRSPQVGCQDTFAGVGLTVTLCPDPFPASCQDAKACPSTP